MAKTLLTRLTDRLTNPALAPREREHANAIHHIQDVTPGRATPMMTLGQRGIQKPPFDLIGQQAEHCDITEDEFWAIAAQVWDYTELPIPVLHNLYCSALYVVRSGLDGDFIECGVHIRSVARRQSTISFRRGRFCFCGSIVTAERGSRV